MKPTRLDHVLELIDQANAKDPTEVNSLSGKRPSELVYGERMSSALDRFSGGAGDCLRIAVRAQHIERWTCPRDSYPDGRNGYLAWRSDLKSFHARRAGELMRAAGYDQPDIDRVGALIRKERLKRDPEAQILEDVACLVFLEHYAGDFIAKHDDDKVVDILKKTARKMSEDGLSAANKLALPDRLGRLLVKTLTNADET